MISARLFIIYADNITNEYTDAINNSNVPKQVYKISSNKLEQKWATDQLSENNLNTKLIPKEYSFETSIQPYPIGRALFADDTCPDISNIYLFFHKLKIYDNIEQKLAYYTMAKVFILLKTKRRL